MSLVIILLRLLILFPFIYGDVEQFGTSGNDYIYGVATDADKNIVVGGNTVIIITQFSDIAMFVSILILLLQSSLIPDHIRHVQWLKVLNVPYIFLLSIELSTVPHISS